jgi:acetylornithine aminotransferase
MVATEEVAAAFGPGSHGSTFGGNPLVTAAAVAALRVLLEDGVLEHCRAVGDYLRNRLEDMRQRYSFIKEVRGRGLILGMEMTIPGAEIVNEALRQGLLINCTVGNVLRFLPPLIVTREEIDEALTILDGILKKMPNTPA